MFNAIDQYVERYIRLTEQETQLFHSLLTLKTHKKKTFLLRAGEVCTFEAYILKGCVRVYYIDDKGDEVILFFAVEDWWISDLASFTGQKASHLFIETLEDTELLSIDYRKKEQLFEQVPAFERLFRLMIQRAYEMMMHRLIATISQPADQRYADFVERYPAIVQRVPQHLIAAYIGISPEFLSKIRQKKLKGA